MNVLVVDDDHTLADVIAFTLRREGYQVIQAYDGEMALRKWEQEAPDLIILDVNLPRLDGFKVCQHIRQLSKTPIILLTVRGEEDDILYGFDLGADDYITKPFSPRQLLARVQAVLRRADKAPFPSMREVGRIKFDQARREVQVDEGDSIVLTPLECKLLEFLMINAGHVVTPGAIIDYVWGAEGGDRDMLRQVIHRLRAKIEPDPSSPIYIETVPGIGYGLTLPTDSN
jgi:DNA-binding response OmpR family regulator